MCISVYVCVCLCMCVFVCVSLCVHVCVCLSLCACLCMYETGLKSTHGTWCWSMASKCVFAPTQIHAYIGTHTHQHAHMHTQKHAHTQCASGQTASSFEPWACGVTPPHAPFTLKTCLQPETRVSSVIIVRLHIMQGVICLFIPPEAGFVLLCLLHFVVTEKNTSCGETKECLPNSMNPSALSFCSIFIAQLQ